MIFIKLNYFLAPNEILTETNTKQPKMSLLSVSQIAELTELVYSCVPIGHHMVDNLDELLTAAVEAKLRAKIVGNAFVGTFVKPSAKLIADVATPLPFMPECVEYGGGCWAIKFAGGLFVPCGKSCKPSTNFCTLCTKKASEKGGHEFGTLSERMEAHDADQLYSAGGKTEISFGNFLRAKKITQNDVHKAIREAGLSINVPVRCYAVSAEEPKKRSGRRSKKAEEADNDAAEEEVQAPKPKAPRVVLTKEEKLAKLEAELTAKEERAALRETEKAVRAEKKAAEAEAARVLKEAKLAEKEAKKAEKEAKKAEEEPKKKTKAAAAKVQEALADLDDDNDDNEAQDSYETVVSKGVNLNIYSDGRVYEVSDKKLRFQLGTYDQQRQNINFNKSDAALAIIAEQLTYQLENSQKDSTKLILEGKVHIFSHKELTLSYKDTIVFIFKDEALVKPADDDEIPFDDEE